MRCPNCSAECPDQAGECEFCGNPLSTRVENQWQLLDVPESAGPPPIPNTSPPPVPDNFESDNPYASSGSSLYGQPQVPGYEVPNHLALSITAAVLSLCCCCIPFGIVPVIFSTQVNSKLAMGDYAGAQAASENAKLWAWISIGVALSVRVLAFLAGFAGALGDIK